MEGMGMGVGVFKHAKVKACGASAPSWLAP